MPRRSFLASVIAATASAQLAADNGEVLRPEDFGARGDGVTNDSGAFAALSAAMNRRGGGTVTLARGKTYVVGQQLRGGQYAWTPKPIIEVHNLTRPLWILGNGARLRCQARLRFGTFDPASGAPVRRRLPNYKIDEVASPYRAMIAVHECRAPIEIRDLELDGNIERLLIGGPYGDTGWQLPASGLWLVDNIASETIVNVYSHHHGQDGAMIDGNPDRAARSRFTRFVACSNGRQGVSIVAGRGYDFVDCEFSQTGRSAVRSAPAAGVDIEAETKKPNRDFTFVRCKFVDNAGAGFLADQGDSDGARLVDCLFVGTTTWSAWPKKPHFAFDRCTFVGAVVNAHADMDPARATRFTNCRFTDDPAMSPTGAAYDGGHSGGPIVNLGRSDNVLFDQCAFDVQEKAVLPWSWKAIYRNCTMSQRSPAKAMTKGKFLGSTVIIGPVDLYGSMVVGRLVVNGRLVPPGPIGVARW